MLKAGRTYITRDGRVPEPLVKFNFIHWPFMALLDGKLMAWDKHGYFYDDEIPTNMDLVREYVRYET